MFGKRCKRRAALFLSSVLFIIKTFASSNTYVTQSGSIDGYSYTINITGDALILYGNTYYSAPNKNRDVTLHGNYVGSGFTGTHTKSNSDGKANGSAVAKIEVYGTNRIISAYSKHTMYNVYKIYGSSDYPNYY